MQESIEKLEKLIKAVYRKWKLDETKATEEHLEEEALVCFLEGRLSGEEKERVKEHLLHCSDCLEAFIFNLVADKEEQQVPEHLLERIRSSILPQDEFSIFEIILKLKEKALEVINTTGDILVGQEFVPAPVLRSRQMKDFKDEVIILKDFEDIRVEVKVENKLGKAFDLKISVKQKQTQDLIKDLRVTLIRDDLELESYLTDSGSISFEHILLGKYRIEIANVNDKLASIVLDIRA